MKIVSIDIAYKKPIPVVTLSERGKLCSISIVQPSKDIYSTSTAILDVLIPIGKCLVVSETPLILNNMNTAFTLARMHAMLEKGTRDAGMLWFGVHPSTWQSRMLHPQKGDDRKKLSIALAMKWYEGQASVPDIAINDDIADAINIANFGFQNKGEIFNAIRGGKHFNEKG
jgi:hypothetical protein